MNFDYGVLFTHEAMTMLAKGLWFTLQLTVLALIGGMLIGTPLAMMRCYSIMSVGLWSFEKSSLTKLLAVVSKMIVLRESPT